MKTDTSLFCNIPSLLYRSGALKDTFAPTGGGTHAAVPHSTVQPVPPTALSSKAGTFRNVLLPPPYLSGSWQPRCVLVAPATDPSAVRHRVAHAAATDAPFDLVAAHCVVMAQFKRAERYAAIPAMWGVLFPTFPVPPTAWPRP